MAPGAGSPAGGRCAPGQRPRGDRDEITDVQATPGHALTDGDVLAELREQGVRDLSELRYVLYGTKGELTIVREHPGAPDGELVRYGLASAVGFPGRRRAG